MCSLIQLSAAYQQYYARRRWPNNASQLVYPWIAQKLWSQQKRDSVTQDEQAVS